jgi:thioesterase domain-containing protein/acyl carrier protein
VFSQLVRSLTGKERFPRLRLIYHGGQTLQRNDAERYQRFFEDHCLLINGLGATEKKVLTQYFMDKQTPLDGDIVPIGYPVDDTEIWLLDEDGKPVRAGEVGEITVKSRHLAAGLWREPELTAATFRPAPEGGGVRIWRTGDLGRQRPDGCLEHLGRVDAQVKIRGHRVELGEVEAALLRLPSVAEGAIAARETGSGERRLVAYLVPAAGQTPTVTELRRALQARLPGYLLPASFVSLAALPRNPNGKLDRAALPVPGPERPALAAEYLAPRTALEARLVAIWEALLAVRPVGVRDDFLELGGDSLSATAMLAAVEQALGRRLPLSTLLAHGTIERLALALEQSGSARAGSPLVAVQPGGARRPFFCVQAYEGSALGLVGLARGLGAEQPLFGFELRAADLLGSGPLDLGRLAERLVAELRRAQPGGPYLLGGYSSGAIVAVEMARQLLAAGQVVPLVALLDQPAPGPLLRRVWWRRRYWGRLAAYAGRHVAGRLARRLRRRPAGPELTARQVAHYVKWYLLGVLWAFDLPVPDALFYLGTQTRVVEEAPLEGLAEFVAANRRYRVGTYPGRLTLLRGPHRSNLWLDDPELGWGAVASGGVEVLPISGGHLEILREPHVGVLAARLAECLDRAGARQDNAAIRPGAGA